jgi:adenosine deaminase
MARDLVSLPKVDLHLHLEGSMRATTVVELAERYGVDLPEGLRDGRYEFRDFRHFIDEFVAGIACLRELDDFRRIAYELVEDEAAEGVRYAEVMVSLPDHRGRFDDWDAVLEAVLDGLADGERDFGVVSRVIVDVVRGIDLRLSRRAMEVGLRHRDAGVVGIGVGGEERFGPEPYEEIFLAGIAGGLHSVPHAGENEGAASIRGAVRQLRAERIGHGISIMEDPELVAEVREAGIALDVCPTSNVMTRSVPSLEEHPLPAMLEAGLVCTLASDDPTMFGSPLAGEYERCRSAFAFGDERLAELARNGVRASFAGERLKDEILSGIEAWLSDAAL